MIVRCRSPEHPKMSPHGPTIAGAAIEYIEALEKHSVARERKRERSSAERSLSCWPDDLLDHSQLLDLQVKPIDKREVRLLRYSVLFTVERSIIHRLLGSWKSLDRARRNYALARSRSGSKFHIQTRSAMPEGLVLRNGFDCKVPPAATCVGAKLIDNE